MTTITLTQTIISAETNGVPWTLNLAEIPADKLADTIFALCSQGVRIIAQRIPEGEGEHHRKVQIPATIAEIQSGDYSFGAGGGGGLRKTPEQDGWIEYFSTKNPTTGKLPVEFPDKRKPNTKNLDEFLNILTRDSIWPAVQAKLLTMTDAEQRRYHKEELPGVIERNMAKLIEREEALRVPGTPGWFIQQERDRREGKKAAKPGIAPLENPDV